MPPVIAQIAIDVNLAWRIAGGKKKTPDCSGV
jgi:hypothetical protein